MACGRTIEPEKYSADYIEHMKREWRQVSMTRLHRAVMKRREEVGILKQ